MLNPKTEIIWKDLSDKLRWFIARRVSDKMVVDDILQEVFLKIHTGIDQVQNLSRLQSWIYQITRNAIIDHYRQHRSQGELPEDIPEFELPATTLPEQQLAANLRQMVNLLPPKYREALRLTAFGGISQVELAQRLNISVSGAKSRVQRGRTMLKKLLQECCHFEFDRRGTIIDYYVLSCDCCSREDSAQC